MQNRKTFLEAVQQPASIDPTYCALLFSQALNPGLNIPHYAEILNSLIKEAAETHIDNAESLLAFVHQKHGFRGNQDEYYQIDNSLLDNVLEKRIGIPVSLALIYLAIGNSTDLTVYGISFPGHFLIGVSSPDLTTRKKTSREPGSQRHADTSDIFIDPYAARVVSKIQCFRLLDQLYHGQLRHDDKYFAPSGNDTILLRLIENIKAIYLKQGDANLALICLDYQLLVCPDDSNLLHQQQQLLRHITQQGGASSIVH